MTATEPKVNPRGLYGATETARALGVNVSTINRAANRPPGPYHLESQLRKSTMKRVFRGQDIIDYWRMMY